MRSVMLLLAVIVGCVVYELDRAWSLSAEWPVTVDGMAAADDSPAQLDAWVPLDVRPRSQLLADPAALPPRLAPAGSEQREHSTRLVGPGVSRQRQTRI